MFSQSIEVPVVEASSLNAEMKRCVTGPGLPAPIFRRSNSTTGITSAAVPTFTGVQWSGGSAPSPGNGEHLLGFVYDGSEWTGVLVALNVS